MSKPIVRPVSFRSDEKDLLDFLEGKYFSAYVKDLIRADMKSKSAPAPAPTVQSERKHKKRITSFNGL